MPKIATALITMTLSMVFCYFFPAIGCFALGLYAGWVVYSAVRSVTTQLRSSAASSSLRITNR